jgi:hypothetical protein
VKKLAVLFASLATAVPAGATTSRILAAQDGWPVPSPDGGQVAFTRVFPNHMELYVFDRKNVTTVRVGSNAGQLAPSWSADGSRLAYASGGVIYTVEGDGTGKRRYVAPTRSSAPAWRPGGSELAYLTTHGAQNTDLWVAGALWAKNVIGIPAWSPDGAQIAFQRDDGIYVTSGLGTERRIASAANPGAVAWSHDGVWLAYGVGNELEIARASGVGSPRTQARPLPGLGRPEWSPDDARLLVPYARGVNTVEAGGIVGPGLAVRAALGPGAAYLPGTRSVLATIENPGCPGHRAIGTSTAGVVFQLTGSCLVSGTAGADVIEGTPLWGDVILAGAGDDRVHANDRHTDDVDCGPGRDTVWADRADRLTGCEIVHR